MPTLLAAAAAVALIAGCGSSGSTPTSGTGTRAARVGHATALQSNPDVGNAGVQIASSQQRSLGGEATAGSHSSGARSHPTARIQATGRVQHASAPAGSSNDDVNASGATTLNPCTLLTRAEAATITGLSLSAPVEAPLGPTCIYRAAHSAAQVTMAVELQALAAASHGLTRPHRVTVAGRSGYCSGVAKATLLVAITGGQVLDVSAPCGVAERLASVAIRRLVA